MDGEAGGDVEPEGGMSGVELFIWWLAVLSLSAAYAGVSLEGSFARRRRRLGPFELLGAEVERLNNRKKKNNP